MTRQKWTSVFTALIIIFTSQVSLSQTNRAVKRNVAAVLFASLGGAILGLSTLSFYGEPQEHTNNITLGALVGFATGVGYVIYNTSHPDLPAYEYSQTFDLDQKNRRALALTKTPPVVRVVFDF